MFRLPTIAIISLLTFPVCAAVLASDGRPSQEILKEIDATTFPKFDQKNKSAEYTQKFRAEYGKVGQKRAALALELFQADPGNPRVPSLLLERWPIYMMDRSAAASTVSEIEAAIKYFKEPKQADEAAFMRAIASIYANKKNPEKATAVIDDFISSHKDDLRGAMLLQGLAEEAEDNALKLKLMDRVIADYPKSPMARSISATRQLLNQVGKPFALEFDDAIKGSHVTINGLKGKVVVIDFWATWCGPCVGEMPRMKELYARFKNEGVEFIGISLDLPKDEGGLDKLKNYVSKNEILWPQYYLGDSWENDLIKRLGISSIPRVFLVDAEGNLASVDARGKLEKLIPEYLAQARKALKTP